jgi:hypothetical protein
MRLDCGALQPTSTCKGENGSNRIAIIISS